MCIPEIVEWQHKLLHCDFEMGARQKFGENTGDYNWHNNIKISIGL